MNSIWKENVVETLRQLHGEGLSGHQIAAALGRGITKDAVNKKLRRMRRGETGPSPVRLWTGDRTESARRMWLDGRSKTAISMALDCGITPNAVIGKMHRMGVIRQPHVTIETRRVAQLQGCETKRAKSGRAGTTSLAALDDRPAERATEGNAIVAKVEAAPALRLIDNHAFIRPDDPPPDLYAHLRTERSYHDALAAMTRSA